MKKSIFIILLFSLITLLTGCQKGHIHTLSEYDHDVISHWQQCPKCQEITNKEEHNFTSVITKQATHTSTGTILYSCNICGYEYSEEIEKLPDHSFVSIVTIEPTHFNDGLMTYTCSECLYSYTESIPKIEHDYNQKTISNKYLKSNATCTSRAVYYYSCSCGEKSTKTFTIGNTLDHDYTYIKTIEATCENNTTKVYECSVCKNIYDDETEGTKVKYHIIIDDQCIMCQKNDFDYSKYELNEIVLNDIYSINHAGIFYCSELDEYLYMEIDCSVLNIPIIDLNGQINDATKSNEVAVTFTYVDNDKTFVEQIGKVKVQGSSSSTYPKKNYTLKLDKKIKIVDGWGKQKKYCLKANYVDFSQARNVVSANIYGDIVKSRNVHDEFNELVNGGAIDGYPVLVYSNGQYHGLYTLNIPKDKWLFDMEDSDDKNQAIVMGNSWSNSVSLNEPMAADFSNGWELEFASNEESEVDNSTTWVSTSFNNMYNYLHNTEAEHIKDNLSTYINVERCIDTMIYTYVICGCDNVAKNILWVTYDGVQWTCCPYDMDGTWGMVWDGSFEYSYDTMILNSEPYNYLWVILYNNYYDEICDRYTELRNSILSNESIDNYFKEFFNKIPKIVYKTEANKWPSVPSQNTNNFNQISNWSRNHLALMDNILKKN